MTRYVYKAVNAAGGSVVGKVDAESPDHANEWVAARGLTLLELKPDVSGVGGGGFNAWLARRRSVHPEALILFTKQLSTMLRAGIPMMRVFEILENQTENPRLKEICSEISSDVRSGSSLHRALMRYPDVFTPLYCSMVLAGETSGALPQILQRLIYVITHEYKVKSDVRAVIQYPIIVLITLLLAFAVLITLVIPRFAAVYERSHIVLPAPTQVCLALSHIFRDQWGWIVVGLFAGIVLIGLLVRTTRGRYLRDLLYLKTPLIGPLMNKAALSRFASVFSILQAAGVGILDSLHILCDTIGNRAIGRELLQVQTQLESGHGIARPLMSARFFTPMVVNMMAIGEEAGNLEEMLKEISLHYDAEVEYATRRLTTALGPALIAMLAIMVGFFALAVYLPMWDMARIVTHAE